jgi:hypothetical protein
MKMRIAAKRTGANQVLLLNHTEERITGAKNRDEKELGTLFPAELNIKKKAAKNINDAPILYFSKTSLERMINATTLYFRVSI